MDEIRESKTEELREAHRLFHSVWQRVMQGGSEDAPILTEALPTERTRDCGGSAPPALPPADCTRATTPAATSMPAAAPSAAVPQVREAQLADCRNDFPRREAVPFLGSGSAELLPLLQDFQLGEWQSAALYRALSRRISGSAAQSLASLASEDLRAAKRLGAACFLISGVQLQAAPARNLRTPSYLSTLRNRFIEEQQRAARYSAAAAESFDPWLSRLLQELFEEKLSHAHILRLLVEQACG